MRKSFTMAAMALTLTLGSLTLGSLAAFADALQDGATAFKRNDYSRALASWRPLAVQGNPVAQNNLGIMYLDGKGVPQNTSEAVRYLSLSAAAGSSLGQNNLGGLYRDGKGVPRDYGKAAQWFAASASQGNSAGMYNLGLMYEMGQGMKAEPFHAYMWYALAADQGNMPNAAAHRDALFRRMTPAAQTQARQMATACKRNNYKGCT
ncbi:MAG TPA: tetratricopeptide repeat protein [Rhizomicrobium sp.]|jgi:TPR repeat protein|nr:tetratricopeptide repeat protein [Rhizomicrobium sp.]